MKVPKVGIALGGGGVRGFANISALETIDALGVSPCLVTGTSMGALVGALYAAGRSGESIRRFVEESLASSDGGLRQVYDRKVALLKWIGAVRLAWEGSGLLKVDGIVKRLIDEMSAETFEDLKIPLRIVATDFYSGEPVVFESGELLPALKASMAIPGIFVPVEFDGRVLVDGGIANNLPFDLLKDGCDISVAINVAPTRETKDGEPPNMIDAIVGMFDIMVDRLTEHRLEKEPPTIYIHPRLVGIRTLDFDETSNVFEQARPAMADLKERLEEALDL